MGDLYLFGENSLEKKAKIIGIDANPYSKKLSRYGFKIYTGDQSDPDFWKKFFKKKVK